MLVSNNNNNNDNDNNNKYGLPSFDQERVSPWSGFLQHLKPEK